MAVLIKVDGTERKVQPRDGAQFSYEELRGFVGGGIGTVSLRDRRIMYVNDDGIGLGLPVNLKACKIARPPLAGWLEVDGIIPFIHGAVVITSRSEAGM